MNQINKSQMSDVRCRMSDKGQSLVEMIISISLSVVFLGIAAGAATLILRNNLEARTNQIAASLAQEYLDGVSSIAESDWLRVYYPPPAKGFGSQFYIDILKYAYVADYTSGLRIINISNPASPTLTETYNTDGYALDVYVSGNYAYVADGSFGLQIINISNPASPNLVATSPTTYARDVYVSGNYAYVADDTSGLRIINISNPASPNLVATSPTTYAQGVYVSGNYAYVADSFFDYISGLRIINISNPASPTLTETYDTTSNAHDVYVSGNYAYVADGSSGLRIINISNPASPTLTETYDTYYAFGVYVLDVNNYSIISGFTTSTIEGRVFTRYFSIENVNRENCGTVDITESAVAGDCAVNFPGGSTYISEDPSTQKITATVEWDNGQRKISLVKYLTRTQNASFRQSDWSSGFGQENFPASGVNNKFTTSTNINYTTSTGAIIIQEF